MFAFEPAISLGVHLLVSHIKIAYEKGEGGDTAYSQL